MFGLSSLQGLLVSSALAALIAGVGAGWTVHKIDAASYEKLQLSIAQANMNAISAAVIVQRKVDDIANAAEIKAVKDRDAQNVRTVTLTHEVTKYVTPEDDKRYPLPANFCVLHDAAASGSDPADSAGASPVADGLPCSVTASEAIDTIIRNYGEYHKVALQLTELQDWVLASEDN